MSAGRQTTASGRMCYTPSCHSRDDVRPVMADDGDGVLLCARCRRDYWGVSS